MQSLRTLGRRVTFVLSVMVIAVGPWAASSVSGDPPYAPGAPFNGLPISGGLGPTYGETWCAAPTGSIAGQQGGALALIPYEAVGCTLAQIESEAVAASVPDRVSWAVLGQSAGGRDLFQVVINALETPAQQEAYDNWLHIREMELTDPAGAQAFLAAHADSVKIPIYMENNIHGDEEEGADSFMQVIRDLATTPYGTNQYVDELLDHAIIIGVPNFNPDGRTLGQRANANNFDMNRDWLVQSQPEVQAEVALIQQWIPTVGLATHGYVNPTLVDGVTKPHNPGLEYDIYAYWNQRRLDANQAAFAGMTVPTSITRPNGGNTVGGSFTSYCSSGASIASPGGNCGGSRSIAASPNGLVEVGNTVTVTTTAANTIDVTPGARITIAGASVAAYNGTFVIASVIDSTHLTFVHTTSGLAPSGAGTAVALPGPANAESWDDWGPFYTQTYLAFMGPDSSTLEMCDNGTVACRVDKNNAALPSGAANARLGSKRAQYVGFYAAADFWVNHRDGLLHDQLEIFRRGVEGEARQDFPTDSVLLSRGWLAQQNNWQVEFPKAFVIPWDGAGRSQAEANRLAEWLLRNGIRLQKMTADFEWNGTTFPAGSYVVPMNQALRGLAYTALSAGQDVSQRITQLYAPPGAWSHGQLWGADTVEIPRGDGSFSPATEAISAANAFVGGVRDGILAPADWYAVKVRGVRDFKAVQDLLDAGYEAEIAEAPFTSTSGGAMPAGTLIFKADMATRVALDSAGLANGLWFERSYAIDKPATTAIGHAPKVGVLVNSAGTLCPALATGQTATCSDTTETLQAIFGDDVSLISITTGAGSLANAATDPLLGIDVLYNAGQAYPGAGTQARARLNAFFQRGGGYIASSQSATGFTFMTAAGNALVGGTFTGATTGTGGGIARWTNVGGAASPITGSWGADDYVYIPSAVAYFSATPTGAVVDGRYLANMGDGANGPTAGFVSGLWRTRNVATNNAPIIVHGAMQAPYTGRYTGLALNATSRQDAERAWTLFAQGALWGSLTDEARLQTITFAAIADATYGDSIPVNPTSTSGLPVSLVASGDCTVDSATAPANVLTNGVGTCTVTASQAGDGSFDPATDQTRIFEIGPAGTSISAVLTPSGDNPTAQFSDTVSLDVTVTPDATTTGDGVFSGTLEFSFNGATLVSGAVTNLAPTLSASYTLDEAFIAAGAGAYSIEATYTPDADQNYAGSTLDDDLAVQKEGLDGDGLIDGSTHLDYSGDQYITVGKKPNLVATLDQSLAPEASDVEYVDFSAVTASVKIEVFGPCNPDCPVAALYSTTQPIANRGDWATTGAGSAQNVPAATWGEGSYDVRVTLLANGFIAAETAESTLTIAPASGSFVSGGGSIVPDSTSNVSPFKGQFGFTLKAVNKNTIQGSVSYSYKLRMNFVTGAACTDLGGNCRDVNVKVRSNKVNGLSITSGNSYPFSAFATGAAKVQYIDASTGLHYAAFEFANGTLRIDMVDANSGGTADKVGLTVYRKDGSVFHQAFAGPIVQRGTGTATNLVTISSGNVAVHK